MAISADRPLTVGHLRALERLVIEQEARASLAWVWTPNEAIALGSAAVTIAYPLARTARPQVVRLLLYCSGTAAGTLVATSGSWRGEYEVAETAARTWAVDLAGIVPWHPVELAYSGSGTLRLLHVVISRAFAAPTGCGQFVPADAGTWNALAARSVAARRTPRCLAGWIGSQALAVPKGTPGLWGHFGALGAKERIALAANGTRTAGAKVTVNLGDASDAIAASGTGWAARVGAEVAEIRPEWLAEADSVSVTVQTVTATGAQSPTVPGTLAPGTLVSSAAVQAIHDCAAAGVEVPVIEWTYPGGEAVSLGTSPIEICAGIVPPCVPGSSKAVPARLVVFLANTSSGSRTATASVSDGSETISGSATIAAGGTATITAEGTLSPSVPWRGALEADTSGTFRIYSFFAYC